MNSLITEIILINYVEGQLNAFAQEDYTERVYHYLKIQFKRNVFHVNKIILHSFNHLWHIFSIAELHHAPGSETRLCFKQVFEIRSVLRNKIDIIFSLRPWSDKAHITAQYVQKLWKLVQF